MSITRHHAEWLSLLDISGPFLSLKVLTSAFPQGLDAPDADVTRELRLAYEEWLDSAFGNRPDPDIHRTWVAWVLRRVLDMPDAVLQTRAANAGDAWPAVKVPEYGEELYPDFVIAEPGVDGKPRMFVQFVPAGQDLEKALAKSAWQASPATRMMTLLRGAGVRLGLLTNGEQWTLVDRSADENMTTGFASWYARLWLDEPLTLRAFHTLLGAHRLFGVPEKETIEALLSASANDRQEVTDQLGYQVRRAIELLVQAIDLADQNESRALLHDVPDVQLYEASITVMMRLVFLLFAEEQNLLLLGDDIYDRHYAVSTLLETLRESADRLGEEVLERRFDAWSRLLAIFRAVYSGFRHDRLSMPAYGGRLFDPDRFAFLEGRTQRTSWHETPADPLPISNRVVLHLLEALQVLRMRVRDGAPVEARRLSFRALDIEQIGHVYEGLLDHTAIRATEPVLGLTGTRDQEPEIPLATLETFLTQRRGGGETQSEQGQESLLAYLQEQTGRSANALKKAWAAPLDAFRATLLRAACGNDEALYARVLPFAGLVRDDDYGRPVVIPAGSVYVTAGAERRSTGTHYTPRSLTEPIVQHTLEPLVYVGPAEGTPREEWTLHSAADLLKLTVCDMAMGSGAFLVQACRYLSERLLEAWAAAEAGSGVRVPGSGGQQVFVVQGDNLDGSANLPRPGRLAEEHGSGGRGLSADEAVAEGGAVWPDQPDTASGGFGAGEYRGGIWQAASQGVHQSPVDRARLVDGAGDAHPDRGAPELPGSGAGQDGVGAGAGRWNDAASPDPIAGSKRVDSTKNGSGTRTPEPGTRRLITAEGFLATNPDEAIPADADERLILARRLIADRCLYGVDRNPLAVDMAKLSLWLITLAKGQPFSFLDHALRSGDSLLGISEIGQLTHWSLDKGDGVEERQTTFITRQVEEALDVALRERRKIAGTRVREARDADLKAGWLATADAALALVKLGADLLIASALHANPRQREGLRNEWLMRYSLLLSAAEETRAGRLTVGGHADAANRAAYAALRGEADKLLAGRKPFHWPLEFPEIFSAGGAIDDTNELRRWGIAVGSAGGYTDPPLRAAADDYANANNENNDVRADSHIRPQRDPRDPRDLRAPIATHRVAEGPAAYVANSPGFAAIVGNPPFMGSQKMNGVVGTLYREYLVDILADGKRGQADLCAYFFLRAGTMLRQDGNSGLIATNTIAQGDTREVGLDQLMAQGFSLPRAVPSRPWPGVAGVDVAHVWLHRGLWQNEYILNDQTATGITAYLTSPGAASGKPYQLKANGNKSFIGSYVLGMGFVLESDEAQTLIAQDPHNREALFPYLNGEDLNSRPDQSPSRWVINFHDWPLEQAEIYPKLMTIVREKVKPERDKNNRAQRRERWWQYAERTPALVAAMAEMKRVLITAAVSPTTAFHLATTDAVFAHKLVVFAIESFAAFGILQSTAHREWAYQYSSTLGATTLNYSPSDCFETFPFPWMEDPKPETRNPLHTIGEQYHTHRQNVMRARNEGLTKTYNRFHDQAETSADIAELRRLHVEMDQAVAAAYGWAELDLGHGFHATKQGLRYTISEAARRTVLDRLLALNHERYAEEMRQGLHDKGAKKAAGKGKRGKTATEGVEQGELF